MCEGDACEPGERAMGGCGGAAGVCIVLANKHLALGKDPSCWLKFHFSKLTSQVLKYVLVIFGGPAILDTTIIIVLITGKQLSSLPALDFVMLIGTCTLFLLSQES